MDLTPALGASTSFSKTVSESDIYLFAGITGDFAPNHVNEQFMRGTQYGRRIAHGALLVGYMSTTSTMDNALMAERVPDIFPVSLGYDRVRFLKPVLSAKPSPSAIRWRASMPLRTVPWRKSR